MDTDADVTATELVQAIETARSMVGEQFQIAERLDRKARYQAATSGAFFAVVQAVALNAITGASLSKGWIGTLAAFAIASACFAIAAVAAASRAWVTQDEKDIPLADLRDIIDRMERGEDRTLWELAHHYANVAADRREKNGERLKRVKKAGDAAILSIALTALQLILVFVALSVTYG
jgi:hypothetical protein